MMDDCGIDYTHLSFCAPGSEPFDAETSKIIAKDANDVAAAAVAKYPDRYGAFFTPWPPRTPNGR